MSGNSSIRSIYVSLPVKDIQNTRRFWTALGFGFNEKFSGDNDLCLVLNDGSIYAMLISYEHFSTFTNRPIADGSTSQIIIAIEVESREKVDEIMKNAFENGASRYMESADDGWMYIDRFADPDGHQWEVLYMDESLMPQE